MAYAKCVATLWHDRVYLFVRESRAPVTWSSKPYMYALRTNFLDRDERENFVRAPLTEGFIEISASQKGELCNKYFHSQSTLQNQFFCQQTQNYKLASFTDYGNNPRDTYVNPAGRPGYLGKVTTLFYTKIWFYQRS